MTVNQRNFRPFLCSTILCLVIVRMASAQREQALPFNFDDGSQPQGGLISDSNGNLYGTTYYGGSGPCTNNQGQVVGCGTIFEISPPVPPSTQWTETVLHSFNGDGVFPVGNLVMDPAGNLFAVTLQGGIGTGSVNELSPPSQPGGVWTETTICSFGQNCLGEYPQAGLVMDQTGNLYGTALGNEFRAGLVYELTPTQNGAWQQTVLYNFSGGSTGSTPECELVLGSNGDLYGTTTAAGANNVGVAFELSPPPSGETWTETVLHNFGQTTSDGSEPVAGLTFGPKGVPLGTTTHGGQFGGGTVFGLQPPPVPGGAWGYKVLYNFGAASTDGTTPYSTLLFYNGSVYGTTSIGGTSGAGTVFQMQQLSPGTLSETETYSFTGGRDGAVPMSGVTLKDYALYGTTTGGGFQNNGTAFRISH